MGIKPSTGVTVVSVAFNSAKLLPSMLASVPEGTPVVVVDNNSSDGAAVRDICSGETVTLIEHADNLGFSTACNTGAKVAKTEFLFFLNPDAVLCEDTLDNLVAAAKRYPEATGFNPYIENEAGKSFFKHGSRILPQSLWLERGCPDADLPVPVLTGAALFVRKSAFDRIGGFDESIFLYFEDDDLSFRLAGHGPLMFIREARVLHEGGASSGRALEIVALKSWHLGHSQVYVGRKHCFPFAFSRAFFPAFLKAFLPDILVRPAKRAKRWGFLMGVISAGLGQPSSLRLKNK